MKLPEECRVAYHHSCHLLRELHGHDHPLQLLDDVEGCTRVEWTASERCCGFGGLFSMKLPEVSWRWLTTSSCRSPSSIPTWS